MDGAFWVIAEPISSTGTTSHPSDQMHDFGKSAGPGSIPAEAMKADINTSVKMLD